MSMKRRILIAALVIAGGAACGIGGAALGGLLLGGCGTSNPPPVVAPNPNGADCQIDREMLQLTCARFNSTREAINKCLADAKLPDCATEAGVAAYITSRADAGAEGGLK